MKKLFSILCILAFLIGMSAAVTSCTASKKSKTSAVRSVSVDSVSIAHSESTEVKLKDSSSLVMLESRTIKNFGDFIDATMALDLNEVDSLESAGIKVVAKLEPTASGSYKLKIKATAKANRLEDVFTSTDTKASTQTNLSQATDNKMASVEKESTDTSTEKVKKKQGPQCLGGFGYCSALQWHSVYMGCTKTGIESNERENQNINQFGDNHHTGSMAETLRVAYNRCTGRQVLFARDRHKTEAGHLRLQGVDSGGTFDALNGCLQG